MSSKVILITGGTSGLGLAAARECLTKGHTVVITGRNEASLKKASKQILKNLDLTNKLYTILLDLNNLQSVREAAEQFKALKLPLNVLINNAGLTTPTLEFSSDCERVEKTIFVNAISPLYFTHLLFPLFDKTSRGRIIWISSSLHDPKISGGRVSALSAMPETVDFDNLDGHIVWDSMLFYKLSKLGNVWISNILNEQLLLSEDNNNVSTIAICPGFVPTTALSRNSPWILQMGLRYVLSLMSFTTSEAQAAADYEYYATTPDLEAVSGKFLKKRELSEGSEESKDLTKAKRFWDLACEITGIPKNAKWTN
ncbi:hypothetical protein J3Q64DRAFT_1428935 [Phycomyces blakesleeanus]|uniref:Uncharacterized protein n=2 Tax=Phycomyces blakesleeanus TaxID=4837 RepID=A0A162WF69_PHYB8|nr:hypothetical protein PHYBLDRAFT_73545 [Phycomyces blakesleeanus NRRL 1555(-)]OAD66735.1 hypothetical protein PHYBLDRAFT_73545 [Phycomyces blakesleeanus NRRL 1555(-)]|eukprot:XP_018284775.1 hypothetical protein PHYBLDRAFT_73545 [Phycomyces blakesleeanus NRRL 1555(-)]